MPIRIALGALLLLFLADPFRWLEPTITPSNKQVTMYSTSWCGYCRKARDVFTRQGITFKELDIEKSAVAKQAYDALNGRGVPLILVDDQQMTGFDVRSFKRLYEQ
ncbi:MAG: glutaredoxin family protein [Piscirickettsiaceae bacterium]|jgi:glutaredoxin|nr:glutaredoxin family protein [Piscirickettsiaceae bacterium]